MLRVRSKWSLSCAVVAVTVALGGCSGASLPAAQTPASTPTATLAPTPTVTETPSRNTLTYEQLLALVQTCAAVAVADPAITPTPLAAVSQWAIEAMVFFASTGECSEIPVIVARDAARTDPEGMVFWSPLQFIEPPCPAATVVSFWAHYDDDLIFANPALQEAFDAGGCLRTFFFTESDAGEGKSSYAANREAGIRAAYDVVRGSSGPWTDQTVVLRNGVTLTLTRPDGDNRVSLLFLGLPDGGLQGSGYGKTGWESLPKLVTGDIAEMHTIEGQTVTLDQLQSTVVELVNSYGAGEVLAHLPGFAEGSGGDHPDHRSVGRIVAAPVDAGLINAAIVQFAQGYPVARRPGNVTGDSLSRKLKAFAVYASHDPVISCRDASGCLKVNRFGDWLQRQYLIPYAELVRDE